MKSEHTVTAKSYCIFWKVDGKLHREVKPAFIFSNGTWGYWRKGTHIETRRGPGFETLVPEFKLKLVPCGK